MEKTVLRLYNYKKGGGVVCDKEKYVFNHIPTAKEIKSKITQYEEKYEQPAHFTLDNKAKNLAGGD